MFDVKNIHWRDDIKAGIYIKENDANTLIVHQTERNTTMTSFTQTRSCGAQRIGSKGFFARVLLAHDAWRQRHALSRLDATALRDIGLTKTQADTEARKPLWDVPSHWLR